MPELQSKQFRAVDGSIELYVNVLTMGVWPTYDMIDLAIPPNVCIDTADLFCEGVFGVRFRQRVCCKGAATWGHSLGSALALMDVSWWACELTPRIAYWLGLSWWSACR